MHDSIEDGRGYRDYRIVRRRSGGPNNNGPKSNRPEINRTEINRPNIDRAKSDWPESKRESTPESCSTDGKSAGGVQGELRRHGRSICHRSASRLGSNGSGSFLQSRQKRFL